MNYANVSLPWGHVWASAPTDVQGFIGLVAVAALIVLGRIVWKWTNI